MMRYPGALLARYHRSDFAALLPHRTLKEAESIASQLIKAVDTLPNNKMLDRDDMIHIGICAWRSGQDTEQVMEHAESATRNAGLQGGNSWAIYDDSLPEKGRGNVRWRTLIEQMLSRGGPRLYQKPAVTREGGFIIVNSCAASSMVMKRLARQSICRWSCSLVYRKSMTAC